MEIITIKTGFLPTNTYLIINEGRAVLIDPGANPEKIMAAVLDSGVEIAAILLTHGHFDHINAVAELKKSIDLDVYLHRDDLFLAQTKSSMYGIKVNTFTPERLLSGGETLSIAGMDIRVIHTPGHTPGGVCYVVGDVIFSGDTLFYRSVGRTDFEYGNTRELMDAIKNRLFTLSGDYRVLPGHECETTLSEEREQNPYVF